MGKVGVDVLTSLLGDVLTSLVSCRNLRSLHARKPQEAGAEMRALLDLMRENGAAVEGVAASGQALLEQAKSELKVLDPEVGDAGLIKSVAIARERESSSLFTTVLARQSLRLLALF